ncbi:MAG: TlpA family protein disulfide reductase [Taibaiella sp.]|nr:TlpA family protein disulfide reductase [Taibaiella sp.]
MKKILASLLLAFSVFTASAQYENTKVKMGEKAPELAYPSPDGKMLKLSEINKGRVVLIDFWASWCGPCRHSNPALVALYNDFKGKKFKNAKNGFTVLSVSLDQTKDAWVKAIKDDNLTWPYHMSDLGGWQSKVAEVYGIQYIPQSVLIDASGKIIGKFNMIEQATPEIQKLVQN